MTESIDNQLKKMTEAREKLKGQLDEASSALDSADETLKSMQMRQQQRMRADKRMADTVVADKLKGSQKGAQNKLELELDDEGRK